MASERELKWWDQFADVMAIQWNLTPALNDAIRSEYQQDYLEYLFVGGGTLLDVGCGTGSLSHGFARRGMRVDGIDFSAEQLELARRLARAEGIESEYFQRDIVNDPWQGRYEQYDSVFVSALLHHLTYDELAVVARRLRDAVRPGGRVFLYEPLVRPARAGVRRIAFQVVSFAWRVALGLFLRLGRLLSFFDPQFQRAMRAGYTGTSPDEHAIELQRLRDAIDADFEIVECRPRHEYSIAFAMSLMLLRPVWRRRLEMLASPLYRLDQWLFRHGMWEHAGMERRWILCGVKLQRKSAPITPALHG